MKYHKNALIIGLHKVNFNNLFEFKDNLIKNIYSKTSLDGDELINKLKEINVEEGSHDYLTKLSFRERLLYNFIQKILIQG